MRLSNIVPSVMLGGIPLRGVGELGEAARNFITITPQAMQQQVTNFLGTVERDSGKDVALSTAESL